MSKLTVVGYEAGATPDHPLIWGAAAVRDNRGVFNAALGGSEFQPRADAEEWADYLKEGLATQIEVEIPIDKLGEYFVLDIRKDLAEREPYKVNEEFMFMHFIVAIGRGPTRTYYVFENHDRLSSWLYHLNAQKFVLVPV